MLQYLLNKNEEFVFYIANSCQNSDSSEVGGKSVGVGGDDNEQEEVEEKSQKHVGEIEAVFQVIFTQFKHSLNICQTLLKVPV